MKKNYQFLILSFCILQFVTAQEQFKFMTYNALKLQSSSTDRFPHFKKIMDDVQPDILVMQEIETQAAVNAFKTNALTSLYSCGTFIDGYDTDRCLCYKLNKFKFVSNTAIDTDLRDINMFKVVHLATGDTLRIFVVHLKASDSQGGSERNQRNGEVQKIREITNTLTLDQDFIVAGDFNFYDSNEPAYNTLKNVNGSVNGYVIDPINMPYDNDWSNSQNIPYHTQSPRAESFGGGIDGGLDDRFDLILYSKSIQNAGGLEYVANSTVPFGNDGQHYNLSINAAPANTAVTQEIADALYYASDHLPVIAEFVYKPAAVNELNADEISIYPNPVKNELMIDSKTDIEKVQLIDVSGKIIASETMDANHKSIDVSRFQPGVYFIKLLTDDKELTLKFIKE